MGLGGAERRRGGVQMAERNDHPEPVAGAQALTLPPPARADTNPFRMKATAKLVAAAARGEVQWSGRQLDLQRPLVVNTTDEQMSDTVSRGWE